MTTYAIALNYFILLLSLAAGGVVCSGLRTYARDAFRQRAFAIRDELFDYAASGAVGFNDPAYWRLRLMMNSVIRFSHRYNFGETIFPILIGMLFETEPPSAPSYDLWRERLDDLSPDTRKAVDDFHSRFTYLLAKHLLVTTPLAWPMIAVVVLIHGARNTLRSVAAKATTIEERALQGDMSAQTA